jgi:hypothetical protein
MIRLLIILLLATVTVQARQENKGFIIENREAMKEVALYYNGFFVTSYCYYDSVMKPFLFPINTLDGITVTRGYPLKPVPGERTDHPHHTGLWMNYESVNGLDFWNNSTAIPVVNRHKYGTIIHNRILETRQGKKDAVIYTSSNWNGSDGKIMMYEQTMFTFTIIGSAMVIDRISTLTATGKDVVFKDVKDGFLGLRVARELELPSQQADVFVDAHGNATTVAAVNNKGVTGNYLTSEGVKGDSVWGTKGNWTLLTGIKDKKNISIGIIDHPANVGYPAYRHARGYGLFAINPLGRKAFSNGKEELNFVLKADTITVFRYRIVIQSGKTITPHEMNGFFDSFSHTK